MGIEFFKRVIEFLNRNNGAFSLVFSAVLAIATIVLALETRRIREAQKEPKIFVSIQPEEGWINWFDIVIQNIGLGAAYNIKFEVNPDFEYAFEYAKGKFLSGLVFIKNGLKYLAPNNEFRCPLISFNFKSREEVEKTFKINTTYQINFTYQNITGKTYKGEYSIDSSQLISIGLTQLELGEPPLYKIATCEEIPKALNSIAVNTKAIACFLSQKPINEEDVKKEQNNR